MIFSLKINYVMDYASNGQKEQNFDEITNLCFENEI